ncbi:MAG: gliding motility lipoprotein GldH [Paludibacteraceae bacterium]|nr:gliding motility lipoprotein GldH [Paludibacteraceae bacterium]
MTVRDQILIVISSVLLSSCAVNTQYSEFRTLPVGGWEADSALTFTFDAAALTSPCDILLCIRHTETYPYQNMWLFCALDNDSTRILTDTLEFYLADDRGRWLGNGGLKLIEMPVLFAENYQLPDSGLCTFTIQQGMRETQLRGVRDVGLIIRYGQK